MNNKKIDYSELEYIELDPYESGWCEEHQDALESMKELQKHEVELDKFLDEQREADMDKLLDEQYENDPHG
ncbi:MAG: hypothetical protein HQL54_03270 [Magnetococcales bacterium]|nr:hypothetical protein [Magnetococcales bacterium]